MARYSNRLGALLKDTMERKGLTPRDVARMSNGKVSHMTVNEAANGTVPSLEKTVVIALALGEDPNYYLEAAGRPFRFTGPNDLSWITPALAA